LCDFITHINELAFLERREKTDNGMIKEFLQHKGNKRNENPPHIQAHLAAPTHVQLLRSQKSLHFASAPSPPTTQLFNKDQYLIIKYSENET